MIRKKIGKIVDDFRLMDDDFMSKVFDEKDNKCIQLVLQVLLEDKNLKVRESATQKERKAISGHSVKFDVHAIDGNGNEFDVEIQRSDKGAGRRRARYNSALLDSGMLKNGVDYAKLKDSYVIFITENDVLKSGKPLYHIDRTIKELNNQYFDDGSHIIFVNGEYVGNDAIGQLMHDFRCKKASDMKFDILRDRVKFLKEEGGRDSMCKSVEEYGKMIAKEATKKEKTKNIIALLKQGVPSQTIHEALKVPLKVVQELENSLKIRK